MKKYYAHLLNINWNFQVISNESLNINDPTLLRKIRIFSPIDYDYYLIKKLKNVLQKLSLRIDCPDGFLYGKGFISSCIINDEAHGYGDAALCSLIWQGYLYHHIAPRIVRPSFESIYMQLAESLAKRSTCKRLSVGCVITSPDYRKVYSVGYNGNASGLPNTCDTNQPSNCGDLHAEVNAAINCDVHRSHSKHVFVTHIPCKMCAKALINLGNVEKVFYKNEYRNRDSAELFRLSGIELIHLKG